MKNTFPFGATNLPLPLPLPRPLPRPLAPSLPPALPPALPLALPELLALPPSVLPLAEDLGPWRPVAPGVILVARFFLGGGLRGLNFPAWEGPEGG